MHIGDVRDVMATLPDNYADLLVTSPPFYKLRSYLPDEHESKTLEIGGEPTPGVFLNTLYQLTAEWGRLIPEWASICVELGDKQAGSGGAGGDYNENGLREGQAKFGALKDDAGQWRIRNVITWARPNPPVGSLGKRNPDKRTGDYKFRPACSFITVACRGTGRYFDLDAVRTESKKGYTSVVGGGKYESAKGPNLSRGDLGAGDFGCDPAGAPPLDWHTDDIDGDWLWKLATAPYPGSHYATYPLTLPRRLVLAMCPLEVCSVCGWPRERVVTQPTEGRRRQPELAAHIKARREAVGITSAEINDWFGFKEIAKNWERTDHHGAAIPSADVWPTLKERLGLSDDFDDVVLGERRWIDDPATYTANGREVERGKWVSGIAGGQGAHTNKLVTSTRHSTTLGFTDCGHGNWRNGHVLDPFGGSGTTAVAAALEGRDATLIDLDVRNVDLVRRRLAENVRIVSEERSGDVVTWTVEQATKGEIVAEAGGQMGLFAS
jgi:site-specific DNA-methyltransferase (adenine-specific)